jgi:hypothetical protein
VTENKTECDDFKCGEVWTPPTLATSPDFAHVSSACFSKADRRQLKRFGIVVCHMANAPQNRASDGAQTLMYEWPRRDNRHSDCNLKNRCHLVVRIKPFSTFIDFLSLQTARLALRSLRQPSCAKSR